MFREKNIYLYRMQISNAMTPNIYTPAVVILVDCIHNTGRFLHFMTLIELIPGLYFFS